MKRCTETDSAIMRCPDYPWKCEMCGAYKEPTNADHIRSMTDEELAEFIADFWFCRRYCPERNRVENEPFIVQGCDGECERHSFDWLKQPYGGDT